MVDKALPVPLGDKITCAICGHHEPKILATVLEIDDKTWDTCLRCKSYTQPFLKFLSNSTRIKLDYQWGANDPR